MFIRSCRVQWWQLKTSETGQEPRRRSEHPTPSAMSLSQRASSHVTTGSNNSATWHDCTVCAACLLFWRSPTESHNTDKHGAVNGHGPSCPTIWNLVRNKNTTANNVSLRVEGAFGALDSDCLPVSRGGCSAVLNSSGQIFV
jgi:hypothetical protein